jgi:WD40 repeat protein
MITVLAPPASPYRGLAAFGDSDLDALFFFGREREREVIVANLLASRLTVLYGPSGVGKSSVLRAGVARRLREVAPEAEVHVLDRWTGEPHLPVVDGEAYVILDQLDEYFLYHGVGGPLVEELPELLLRAGTSVLLSIREDALAKLDAFQARIPNVFGNQLRLDELDTTAGRTAIVGPIDRWNELAAPDERIGIEPVLVTAVLEQVAARRATGAARVEAPYLQLVLQRIWEEERGAGSRLLRLETLERLGGAATIVRGHLERAIGGLPGHEAEVAADALRFLVTPSRTKIAHTVADLAGYTTAESDELDTVLRTLTAQRILRAVAPADGEAVRYEIFHDVLAEPVLEWRHEFEAHTALEREHRRHRRLLLLAVGALVLAAMMATLAVFALAQRHEAQQQAELAQASQAEAIRQANIAEQNSKEAQASAAQAQQAQQEADANAAQAQEAQQEADANAAQAEQNAAAAQASEQAATQESARAQQQQAVAEQQKGLAEAASRQARANAAEAKRQASLATVGADVARSSADLTVDPVASVRSALAASGLESSPRVEDALRSSLVALRLRAVLDGGGGGVDQAVFSPDGSLVATGSEGGELRIFSTTLPRLVQSSGVRTSAAAPPHRLLRSVWLGGPVVSVAFSADGSRLLAATSRGSVSIRNARSGDVLTAFSSPGLRAAAFAADGTVATGSRDGTFRIWDAANGALLRSVSAPMASSSLAVSPDGSLVAFFDTLAPTVDVVDIGSGAIVASLQQQGNVASAAFSPDGALLVTGGHRNAYVWNTSDWSLRHLLVGHTVTIVALAFSRDGLLATASEDASARVWDPAAGTLLFILASQHQQKLLAAAFGPQGTLATASADRTARIWPASFGLVPLVLAGHTDSVTSVSFSPGGRFLLTGSADGTARLWDAGVPGLSLLGSEGGRVADASFSPDGRLVVAGGADATARIWRADGTAVATLRHGGKVTAASFVDHGTRVLTASEDGMARLWTTGGALVRTFADGAPVRAALAEPDGDVVTAGDDGIVRMWAPSGRLLWSRADHSPIVEAALAPDGTVATGDADGTVRLRRPRDGVRLHVLRGHTGAVTTLAFSPDGTLLASGGADGTIRIRDASSGRIRHVLKSGAALTSISFSPAGSLLLTADVNGNVRTWSPLTGHVVHDLRFHVSIVNRASFSSDGRWIVTAGPSTAGLWQTRTGTLLFALGGSSGGPLTTASFSPSGFTVLTGGNDGSVRTYRCPVCGRIPALRAQAHARLAALHR